MATYLVLSRCKAGVRVRPGVAIEFENLPTAHGAMDVRIFTRYEEAGLEVPLPRELCFELRCDADELDGAVAAAAPVAVGLSIIAAFCANTSAATPQYHLAYDATPGLTERAFREVFQPDETGGLNSGRWLAERAYVDFVSAVGTLASGRRATLALGQYDLALRHWNSGARVLTLAHLYMAAEALTGAVEESRREADESREMHAARVGIDTTPKKCEACGQYTSRPWKPQLDAYVRRHYIFAGDEDTFRSAKRASDGFEHGYLGFEEGRQIADASAHLVFGYVRQAILDLLPLPAATAQLLSGLEPIDVTPYQRVVQGHLVGRVENPEELGPAGEKYPLLHWESSITQLRFTDGDKLQKTTAETFMVRTAEQVAFRGGSYQVFAGLNAPAGDDRCDDA